MRIEKNVEEKDYIEILEAVRIVQDGESILLEKGDRIRIISESGDPGMVFQTLAKNAGFDLVVDRSQSNVYILRIDPRDLPMFDRAFDDLLKNFYAEVSTRWKVVWDQNNDNVLKIF